MVAFICDESGGARGSEVPRLDTCTTLLLTLRCKSSHPMRGSDASWQACRAWCKRVIVASSVLFLLYREKDGSLSSTRCNRDFIFRLARPARKIAFNFGSRTICENCSACITLGSSLRLQRLFVKSVSNAGVGLNLASNARVPQ